MKKILSILILFLIFGAQGQISESWNLNIDSYTHNSSNYASKNPPIEIAEFSNKDRVILTQKGTLTKLNTKGERIWKKEVLTCARQRIIVDINDNIFLSCGSEITKFDLNGEVVWKKEYSSNFNKKYLTFDALISDKDKIYLVGHFFHSKYIFQLLITTSGNVLWKTKFKQGVDYDFSFLPPKQIILNDGRIYILAYDYSKSNSFLYLSNLNGKKRKEIQIDYKIKKLKLKKGVLFAIGHLNNLKDKLIFSKLDKELSMLEKSEFELPQNFDYEKAIRGWASSPPTKEIFEKKYITAYTINDFEFLDNQNILVVGDSYEKPWIAKVDLKKEIVWNWDNEDSRYFNFNNEYFQHYFSLYSINQIENRFIISGICEEEDYKESGFKKYINIFIREMELGKIAVPK